MSSSSDFFDFLHSDRYQWIQENSRAGFLKEKEMNCVCASKYIIVSGSPVKNCIYYFKKPCYNAFKILVFKLPKQIFAPSSWLNYV